MIYRKQLNLHKPEEGIIGDCWRTCIACILDLQPDAVPHFVEHHWNEPDATKSLKILREYLAPRNLSYVEFPYNCSLEELLTSAGYTLPEVHYILSGTSANKCNHSVVAKGNKIVWDPAIDDSGIIGPMDDGYYWIGLIVHSSHL